MITLMQVIQELRPGAQCRIIGDTYNDITWDDKNQTIPTEDEVDKKLKELCDANKCKKLEFFKSQYLASKEVNAWLGLYEVVK